LSNLDLQATLGLLRICTRLLPYKEASAEALLKSLQLVLRLDPHVAWDLAQQIATELLKLVKSSAAYIRCAHSNFCGTQYAFQHYRAAEVSQVKRCLHQVRSTSVLPNTWLPNM